MPNTVVDLDAAMVAGLAKAGEWEAQFQAQFYGPLLMAQAVQMFLGLTPEQQDQLRAADPEVFDELKAQVAQMRGGMNGNSQVQPEGRAAVPGARQPAAAATAVGPQGGRIP